MLKKLFGIGQKQDEVKEETVFSPVDGQVLELSKVPDPVFSQKMMGDGMAVEPSAGEIVSPVDGEVIQLFHTKHAIGIGPFFRRGALDSHRSGNRSNGRRRFTTHVKEGDKVKVGDPLITCDLELIKEKASSTNYADRHYERRCVGTRHKT